jgi:DNA repair exonuclease SbcCD nuclease subunit
VHCAEQWAAKPQALPDGAHYVALGHIHRPQTIDAAPTPTRYAGSPLQLDFGEAGEEKSFVLVEAIPGRPAQIKTVPYEGGRALRKVSANLEELEGLAPSLGDAWLHVTVRVPRHDPELHAKVQRVLPNAVKVQEELIGVAASEPPLSTTAAVHTPVDRYGVFVREERGCDPDGALLEAFEKLRVDCASEDG